MERCWHNRRRWLTGVLAGLLVGCAPLADFVESKLNRVEYARGEGRLAPMSDAHWAMFRDRFAADLHADTLLFDRDLLEHSTIGHVDLPRLVDGGTDLQVFAMVTHTPLPNVDAAGCPLDCITGEEPDTTGLLQFVQGRPLDNWFGRYMRALSQARRLRDTVCIPPGMEPRPGIAACDAASSEVLVPVETFDDLAFVVAEAARGPDASGAVHRVGAMLALEGAHGVGGFEGLGTLHGLGLRMIAPTHRFDNAYGGASEGCSREGLTIEGAALLRQAIAMDMVVDLAHASRATLTDSIAILQQAGKPFVVSHTGLYAQAPCVRNLSDDDVVAIARAGGIIGVGYWPAAIGNRGTESIVEAMNRVAALLKGEVAEPWDHVALGSDFDGSVAAPFDAAGIRVFYARMEQRLACTPVDADGDGLVEAYRCGDREDILHRVLGGNACRVFATVLEGGSPQRAADLCAGP